MWRSSRFVVALLATLVLASGAMASAASAPAQPSEPFFPRSGNRGYDVKHYDVTLGYQPRSGMLTARDVVEARATSGLTKFSLDLNGLKVTSVSVDGEAATYSRGRGKVKIVPASRIAKGESFTVELRYQGVPRKVIDPDGSPEGWYRTKDGAIGVGEPVGTAAWLACNNAPRDKAGFDIDITVPSGVKAVSNGRLISREKVGGRVRWAWSEPKPMATYLALVDIGKGKLITGHVGKLPTWTLIDPKLVKASRAAIDSLPEIIRWESASIWRLPVRRGGLGGRRRQARIRAGDPDPADLRLRARPHDGRPRDRPPVVWRLGQPRALAQHLAERGPRDLDPVVLRREARRPHRPAGLRRALPQTRLGDRLLGPAVRPSRPGEEPVRGLHLRTRRDDPPGPARQDRHP